jgi:hypothetical protein
VEEGVHRLALQKSRGAILPVRALPVNGATTVQPRYEDRSGVRVAGWLVFFTTLIGGTVAAVAGHESKNAPLMTAGFATLGAGAVGSLPLVAQPDGASLSVVAITVGSNERSSIVPNGLGLSLTF